MMKYDEKDIEEYLNNVDVRLQIEIQSNIAALIQLLYQKGIITKEEFNETNNKTKEIIKSNTKEKIKEELEKYRSNKVKLKENTFHIYDAPESIHVKGDLAKAKILDILGKYSSEFKYRIQIYEK